MAQAAYCDKCGANVYVNEDGRCPNGHGPESLSKYYETEDQPPVAPPADTPPADAPPTDTPSADAVPPAVVPPVVIPPAAAPPATVPPASAPPAAAPPEGGIPTSPPPTGSPSPAATAYAQATPGGPAPKKKSKLGLIIGIIVAILLLCGVGATVATCALVDAAEDASSDLEAALDEAAAEIEAELENELGEVGIEMEEEPDPDDDSDGVGIELEIEAMVKNFYPGFTMIDYAETDTVDGATSYHILTQSEDSSDFYMTFFAERDPNGAATDPDTQFDDERAGIVWNHPETVSHGLRELAGPGTLDFTDVMDYFGAEHSDMNVTEFSMNSNVMVTFRGISDDDLDTWYDDFTTFESVWESNIVEGTWEETSFTRE